MSKKINWDEIEHGTPAEQMAKRFHETYERLAPLFGYETRAETRAFDPESANGKLMIAVCADFIAHPQSYV